MATIGDLLAQKSKTTLWVDFLDISKIDHGTFDNTVAYEPYVSPSENFLGRYGVALGNMKGDTVGERYSDQQVADHLKAVFPSLPAGYVVTGQDKQDLKMVEVSGKSAYDTLFVIPFPNTPSTPVPPVEPPVPVPPPAPVEHPEPPPVPKEPALNDDVIFVLDLPVSPPHSPFKADWLQKVSYARMKRQWAHPAWPFVNFAEAQGNSGKRAVLLLWLAYIDAEGPTNPTFQMLEKEQGL
jgi:hypothetical protein